MNRKIQAVGFSLFFPIVILHAGAQELVQGNTRFALELYRELGAGEGNLFYSPYSISAALAMTSAGARGQTLKEINSVLHLPSNPHAAFGRLDSQIIAEDKPYTLNVANRIWPRKGLAFYPSFLSTVKSHYGAEPHPLDFGGNPEGSRITVNRWVSDQTAQKIKDIIPQGSLNAGTAMVLTNAIYFKGLWESAFKKRNTGKADFYPDTGSPVPVDMMNQEAQFPYGKFDQLQILELAYKGEEISMVILLPDKGASLAQVADKLSPEQLENWLSALHPRTVKVTLPRFSSRFKAELKKNLIKLGMPTPFLPDVADFGAMRSENDLFIDKVFHEAFVEVDEEGTEAAAATAVVVTRSLAVADSPVFRAERPFLYIIRHRPSGSILFLGRLARPAA